MNRENVADPHGYQASGSATPTGPRIQAVPGHTAHETATEAGP
jgi:hypothetical protein